MKNSIKFIAPLALLLSISACNKDKDPEPVAQKPQVEKPVLATNDSTTSQTPDQTVTETPEGNRGDEVSGVDTKPDENQGGSISSKSSLKTLDKFTKEDVSQQAKFEDYGFSNPKKDQPAAQLSEKVRPVNDKGLTVIQTTSPVSNKQLASIQAPDYLVNRKVDTQIIKESTDRSEDLKRPHNVEIPANLVGHTFKFEYIMSWTGDNVDCEIQFITPNTANYKESNYASSEDMFVRYNKADDSITYQIGQDVITVPISNLHFVK
ncbi:hypothetical protein MY04_3465 [Flammeovirga sp. MY04]|uniref:hypothetical protein n=1 Tax=Flammeovirga sp. MY04 TaxID=1191459 RepID=UPI0008063346|nr:hypothetical protein [Flammeovirga sp. MY04]ANQ50818.1 hypothetical protein MY04_3465 [Flammeovirga sp. MY04]